MNIFAKYFPSFSIGCQIIRSQIIRGDKMFRRTSVLFGAIRKSHCYNNEHLRRLCIWMSIWLYPLIPEKPFIRTIGMHGLLATVVVTTSHMEDFVNPPPALRPPLKICYSELHIVPSIESLSPYLWPASEKSSWISISMSPLRKH